MGTVWQYPRPLVEHAAELAGVSERTIRRWCKAGMNLDSDRDILRFKKFSGHPPATSLARQDPDDAIGGAEFHKWLRNWLAAGSTKR
jgi:hypothetical protein